MQKFTPCLWFDDHAEENVNFYASIFKSSKVTGVLGEIMLDKDSTKTERVMKALMQMRKIDVKKLKQAYAERSP